MTDMDTRGVLDPAVYCGHHRIAAPDRFLLCCRGSTAEYDATGRPGGAAGAAEQQHLQLEGVAAEVTTPLLEMTAMQRDPSSCRPLLLADDIDMSTSRPVQVVTGGGDRLWTTSGSDGRLCGNVSASGIIQSSKFTNNVISGRKITTTLGTSELHVYARIHPVNTNTALHIIRAKRKPNLYKL